jgi:hypothetical protein
LDKLLLLLVTLGNVVSHFRRTKIQSKTDCQSFANKCKRTFHYYFTQVRLILVANQNFGTIKTTMASKLPPPPIVNPKRKNFLGQPAPQGYVAGVGRG